MRCTLLVLSKPRSPGRASSRRWHREGLGPVPCSPYGGPLLGAGDHGVSNLPSRGSEQGRFVTGDTCCSPFLLAKEKRKR
eukprot:2913519-Lingulodinium_polyedra.AAC.1